MLSTILGFLLPVLFGIAGTWIGNKINNNGLTGAQQEQNAFNSTEAETQRTFQAEQNQLAMNYNAEEAQKARDFQAQQDNTLYQRRVADMRAAGVNPALAIGGVGSALGSSAAGSVAPASGAAASGSAPHYPQSMSDIMQAAFMSKNLSMIDSQIQMNDAKTMRDLAEAGLLGEQRVGQSLANTWFEPMKEAEYGKLISSLRSDEVQRALARQDIKESQAREALTVVQTAIGKADAATRDQLNRASIRLTLSQASLNSALGAESKKRLGLIDAEINELYQRSIMESLQGGKYSAEELESMERAGLISVQRSGAEMENEVKRYSVDHKKLNYWLGIAGQSASIIGDVAGGAGRLIGGIAVSSKFKGLQIPQGSNLWLPNSQSAFGTQYKFK